MSKIIESVLNDPKNHIEVSSNRESDKRENRESDNQENKNKDFSNTFFSKNKENMVNIDEKNDSVFNGSNGGNRSTLPTINAGNLIKLKEVR